MTPEPPPLQQLLHLVDRAERGVILPAEAAQLRTALRALYRRAATDRELELRQRRTWSAAGRCPMCGHDDTDGRLCSDCTTTVRRLPSPERRQWRRYEPLATSAPIQGHGYTPAGLLGIATEESP